MNSVPSVSEQLAEPRAGKPALSSKTVHFNVWSLILAHAIWPFLPESFRHKDYAMDALAAWFTIGNVIIRFFTTEALSLWGKRGNTNP